MSDKLTIFDTTLRDGEQCPGASMNFRQKMEVARQLERLGVDVIEAGFPVISDGDFEAVSAISQEIKGPIIAGLARCVAGDIDAAGAAVKPAGERGRIHVFLATSKIHTEHKLKKANEEIVRLAVEGVTRAKGLCKDVEFSPEDASRTEPEFLAEVTQAVIAAGATTVNIPDTVGWAVPDEYAKLIEYLFANVNNIDDAVISVHCHNDLGMAVANSLAAVRAGARQIEGTINGIGERAGNAALEEVAMAIKTRPDFFGGVEIGMDTTEIVKTSRLVERMSGLAVQRSKAIVGLNAFAHSSGIHQDGMLKQSNTYEIMDPKSVGWGGTELPLTKHSGRAAVSARLDHLGYKLTGEEIAGVFKRFKDIGDRKKFVYDDDLAALVDDSMGNVAESWQLVAVQVTSGSSPMIPSATVTLMKGEEQLHDSSPGNGAVDASMKAIDRITGQRGKLASFKIEATSEGKDAVAEATLEARFVEGGAAIKGQGASTDTIEASARAYLNALNRFIAIENMPSTAGDSGAKASAAAV